MPKQSTIDLKEGDYISSIVRDKEWSPCPTLYLLVSRCEAQVPVVCALLLQSALVINEAQCREHY